MAAPAIVSAINLMPVRSIERLLVPDRPKLLTGSPYPMGDGISGEVSVDYGEWGGGVTEVQYLDGAGHWVTLPYKDLNVAMQAVRAGDTIRLKQTATNPLVLS